MNLFCFIFTKVFGLPAGNIGQNLASNVFYLANASNTNKCFVLVEICAGMKRIIENNSERFDWLILLSGQKIVHYRIIYNLHFDRRLPNMTSVLSLIELLLV